MEDTLPMEGDSVNFTLASRAGSVNWKLAPKITKVNLEVSLEKYTYFQKDQKVSEGEALNHLPYLLEDSLFLYYNAALKSRPPSSLDEAKAILREIVGEEDTSVYDFFQRKWKLEDETLSSFAFTLQALATRCEVSESVLKAKFVDGLPSDLANKLRLEDLSGCITFKDLVKKAKISLKKKQPPSVCTVACLTEVIEEQKLEIKRLGEEVMALKSSSSRIRTNVRRDNNGSFRCYRCHEWGHISANCPKNVKRPVYGPARY